MWILVCSEQRAGMPDGSGLMTFRTEWDDPVEITSWQERSVVLILALYIICILYRLLPTPVSPSTRISSVYRLRNAQEQDQKHPLRQRTTTVSKYSNFLLFSSLIPLHFTITSVRNTTHL
jgi:hypothetical protein